MKRVFLLLLVIINSLCFANAEENKFASVDISINIPKHIQIESILSPVLTANITDNTGNLHSPLKSKFKITSNSSEPQKLYLKAKTTTESGQENAMFTYGGTTYIAFGNISKIPTSQALYNCKINSQPQDSPNVVAYPIISIEGPKHQFQHNKYEFEIKNGTSYVTVDIGPYVLKNSFAPNDKRGFYQTVLSLTEADI